MSEPTIESDIPKAINSLSNGKVRGPDFISAEVFKEGGPVLLQKFTKLLQSTWQLEVISQEPKDASIVISTREKGTGNYATITKGFYCQSSLARSLQESSSTAFFSVWKIATCLFTCVPLMLPLRP